MWPFSFLFVLYLLPARAIDFTGLNFVEESLTSLANYHSSPCTYEALADYIDLCSEKSFDLVDAHLRLQLAVKLSICEFEEAGVEYPGECKMMAAKEDFLDCVKQFRASSQLWTTYSGNYRKLRSLCYEESLPYTKIHIIELFSNITSAYAEFYHSMKGSFQAASAQQDEMMEKFHQLLALVNDAIQKKKVQFDEFHQDTSRQMEDIEDRHRDFQSRFAVLVGQIVDETLGLRSDLHVVRENTAALSSDFQEIAAELLAERIHFLNAQNFENTAIIHDLRSLALFISESTHHTHLLANSLQHLLDEGVVQGKVVEENTKQLENLSFQVFNLLALLSGLHEMTIETTAELQLELSDIGFLAGSTKNVLDRHFQDVSQITANLTHRLQLFSNHFSSFPLGILSWIQTIASWSLAAFAAISVFTFLTTTLAISIRLFPISKFVSGLIPGLFLGLILRLAWQTYHPSLLHILSLYTVR